jgi:hypothetical protein
LASTDLLIVKKLLGLVESVLGICTGNRKTAEREIGAIRESPSGECQARLINLTSKPELTEHAFTTRTGKPLFSHKY